MTSPRRSGAPEHSPTTMRKRLLCLMMALTLPVLAIANVASAYPTVRAKIGKDSAWVGEAVPISVVLYSPGPFDGTAVFDLPQLPKTAFVKTGNPTVSNEQFDGQTFFAQRHEYTLYTQQSGEIVIPPFRVRFSGKKTFTSVPESIDGTTEALRFTSLRAPGTESMGLVVSVPDMRVRQIWDPETIEECHAGDVVQRTIFRAAKGTTAMVLPEVNVTAPDGIRIFEVAPVVRDNTERGRVEAERIDTIKYQFRRAGTFSLPDVTFTWWDSDTEALKRQTLPGRAVNVAQAIGSENTEVSSDGENVESWIFTLGGFFAVGGLACLLRKPAAERIARWRAGRRRAQSDPVRELRVACARHDAMAAYAALMAWSTESAGRRDVPNQSATRSKEYRELRKQVDALSRRLFALEGATTRWDGKPLWKSFTQCTRQSHRGKRRVSFADLPKLNPTQDYGETRTLS